jgi:hypothetical protein
MPMQIDYSEGTATAVPSLRRSLVRLKKCPVTEMLGLANQVGLSTVKYKLDRMAPHARLAQPPNPEKC